ncbi:tyrosine-type recombinase/integrase [Nocardia amikacinitolerans]|uniref:tyrosine-type recombinase/integrase n=1 Tax=Nocardia amikacinitolerans TaxID=756689 RepID=UPI0036C4069C
MDRDGVEVEPVTQYLRDLALGDSRPLTSRSYGYDLLRWFRLLWMVEVDWNRATGSEVDVLVGWLKTAVNPQRRRSPESSTTAGSINPKTGKPYLARGYSRRTINHSLSAIYGFYAFHSHCGRGPVVNPVPSSRSRRQALGHRSPIDAPAKFTRARLRQRVNDAVPRSIPDLLWDELFAAMSCDRDRALLLCYVSSGARANELLAIGVGDIDWPGGRIYVVSKGTWLRQSVPVSAEALRYLALYLDAEGVPADGEPLWRTRRGSPRAVSYWAMRRVLQRANDKLATNWTLHDLRHTAATRMANDPALTLTDVQAILRHANIETTGRYTTVRVEDLFDKLQEHYSRPRPTPTYAAGYDQSDIEAVFGV